MSNNNNNLAVALGNKLKELRNKHNLTITGLAEILGISHSYVGFLEKGTRKGSKEILKKYADFFQVSLDDLLELQSQVFDSSQIPLSSEKQPTDNIVELNDLIIGNIFLSTGRILRSFFVFFIMLMTNTLLQSSLFVL